MTGTRGLSPSSLALFMGCARKYYLKKVAGVLPDDDAVEDTESLRVGKAFHKCLEDTRHELSGYKFSSVEDVCKGFDLDPEQHPALIYAMLLAYKKVHEKAGLKAIACEQVIDTPSFYGFVDVILEDADGWWIGDMKTAASYSTSLMPTLQRHPQLSLYARHAPEVAKALSLDPALYKGCRYRMTTKSKAARKPGESAVGYAGRTVGSSINSYDYIIPKEVMTPDHLYSVHGKVRKFIEDTKDETGFLPNYGNCMSYFRPCEMWSRCHGARFSDMHTLTVLKSD